MPSGTEQEKMQEAQEGGGDGSSFPRGPSPTQPQLGVSCTVKPHISRSSDFSKAADGNERLIDTNRMDLKITRLNEKSPSRCFTYCRIPFVST